MDCYVLYVSNYAIPSAQAYCVAVQINVLLLFSWFKKKTKSVLNPVDTSVAIVNYTLGYTRKIYTNSKLCFVNLHIRVNYPVFFGYSLSCS